MVEVETASRAGWCSTASALRRTRAVSSRISRSQLRAVPLEGLTLHRAIARAADRPVSRATDAIMSLLRSLIEARVREGRWPHASLC